MGHTCHAWLEDEDRSGAATGIAAISDYWAETSGDNLTLIAPYDKVLLMYAWTEFAAYPIDTVTINCASIVTNGSLTVYRGNGLYYLSDSQIYDFRENPYEGLKAGNEIDISAFETDEAGVAHFLGFVVVVGDGAIPSRGAPRITHIHSMTGAAATAATWTKITQTDVTTLEAGRYRMWGAEVIAATGVAARFIIPGYTERPAVIPKTREEDNQHSFSSYWGLPYEFTYPKNKPNLELLDTTTSTSKITLFLEQVSKG